MDDWVIMCDNRWKFKRIIKKVFRVLDNLKLEIAYDKIYPPELQRRRTKVGRTKNCFDFLGFNISAEGLGVARKSVLKLAERIIMKLDSVNKTEKSRAYGSGCLGVNSLKGDLSIPESISRYVQRWLIWIKSVYGKYKDGVLAPYPA